MGLSLVITEVISESASIVLEDLENHPTPRLSFGREPSEQLVSKQSMEIMRMDDQLKSFQHSWQERREAMLGRHQHERAKDPTSLPAV